jgi:hypothetical protein
VLHQGIQFSDNGTDMIDKQLVYVRKEFAIIDGELST